MDPRDRRSADALYPLKSFKHPATPITVQQPASKIPSNPMAKAVTRNDLHSGPSASNRGNLFTPKRTARPAKSKAQPSTSSTRHIHSLIDGDGNESDDPIALSSSNEVHSNSSGLKRSAPDLRDTSRKRPRRGNAASEPLDEEETDPIQVADVPALNLKSYLPGYKIPKKSAVKNELGIRPQPVIQSPDSFEHTIMQLNFVDPQSASTSSTTYQTASVTDRVQHAPRVRAPMQSRSGGVPVQRRAPKGILPEPQNSSPSTQRHELPVLPIRTFYRGMEKLDCTLSDDCPAFIKFEPNKPMLQLYTHEGLQSKDPKIGRWNLPFATVERIQCCHLDEREPTFLSMTLFGPQDFRSHNSRELRPAAGLIVNDAFNPSVHDERQRRLAFHLQNPTDWDNEQKAAYHAIVAGLKKSILENHLPPENIEVLRPAANVRGAIASIDSECEGFQKDLRESKITPDPITILESVRHGALPSKPGSSSVVKSNPRPRPIPKGKINQQNATTRRSSRITTHPVIPPPLRRELSQPVNELKLVYPWDRPGAVNITYGDYARLDPMEFLNDSLIEYGLKYAFDQLRAKDPALSDRVHLFNSFFYKKYSSDKYLSVRKWTTKVNLFQKDYIIVPINENFHWYLVIIHNPGHLLLPPIPPLPPKITTRTRRSQAKQSAPRTRASKPSTGASEPLDLDMEDNPIDGSVAPVPPSPNGMNNDEVEELAQSTSQMDIDVVEHADGQSSPLTPIDSPTPPLRDEMDVDAPPPPTANAAMRAEGIHSTPFDDNLTSPLNQYSEASTAPKTSKPDVLLDDVLSVPDERKTDIFILDSLNNNHTPVKNALFNYLQEEAKDKQNYVIQDKTRLASSSKIKVPQQPNNCDCGVYLLHFAQIFLEDPSRVSRQCLPSSRRKEDSDLLWKEPELSWKRVKIAEQIDELSAQWKQWKMTRVEHNSPSPPASQNVDLFPATTPTTSEPVAGLSTSNLSTTTPEEPTMQEPGSCLPAPSPPADTRERAEVENILSPQLANDVSFGANNVVTNEQFMLFTPSDRYETVPDSDDEKDPRNATTLSSESSTSLSTHPSLSRQSPLLGERPAPIIDAESLAGPSVPADAAPVFNADEGSLPSTSRAWPSTSWTLSKPTSKQREKGTAASLTELCTPDEEDEVLEISQHAPTSTKRPSLLSSLKAEVILPARPVPGASSSIITASHQPLHTTVPSSVPHPEPVVFVSETPSPPSSPAMNAFQPPSPGPSPRPVLSSHFLPPTPSPPSPPTPPHALPRSHIRPTVTYGASSRRLSDKTKGKGKAKGKAKERDNEVTVISSDEDESPRRLTTATEIAVPETRIHSLTNAKPKPSYEDLPSLPPLIVSDTEQESSVSPHRLRSADKRGGKDGRHHRDSGPASSVSPVVVRSDGIGEVVGARVMRADTRKDVGSSSKALRSR